LVWDRGRGPEIVAEGQSPRLTKDRHTQRIIGAAHAGAVDRIDPRHARTFVQRARTDATHFGFPTPGRAFGKEAATTAGRQRAKTDHNNGAG
jgi:hypothetical protein